MASQQHIVEQVFGAALDHAPVQRAAFLDHACHNAPELRRRVEELLHAEQQLGSFLEHPALGPVNISPQRRALQGEQPRRDPLSDAPPPCLQPDELLIDRFRVIRFLARGGMGEIYEVEDLFLQNVRVALKLILPEIADSPGSARRFEQEVLLARTVIHPNLCPIYDIARSSTSVPPFLFLTMKLLSGETLASRLQQPHGISPRHAFSILQQLCAGLAALHQAGILHRDIKPTNVMLEHTAAAPHVYIMDFGLARSYEVSVTRDASGVIAGTPGYLAPELLRGEQPSRESDIFALGVLLRMVQTHVLSEPPSTRMAPVESAPLSPEEQEIWRRAVSDFRSEDQDTRSTAFSQIAASLHPHRTSLALPAPAAAPASSLIKGHLSRRRFTLAATAAVAAAGATALWQRARLEDLMHPLPSKRFVALLKWPAASDPRLQRMLSTITEVIGRELARAEVFDHNLLVITDTAEKRLDTAGELRAIREASGANLILAASARLQSDRLSLTLQVLDTSLVRPLRERLLHGTVDDQLQLPARAVEAASELLGIAHYTRDEPLLRVGTRTPEAYIALEAAEALRRQDTTASLNQAITLYQKALNLDPRYAVAWAKLSWAYLRVYVLHRDPAALTLARDACAAALARDPDLVDAHVVLAWVFDKLGDQNAAARELAKALALDPADQDTLRFQARFFAEHDRPHDAEERLKELIRRRPNFWLAHNELGSLFNDQANYAAALAEFHAAKIAAPGNWAPLNNIGSVLLQQGDLSGAAEALKQSYALEPSDAAAANLAAVARLRSLPAEALRLATLAVTLNPDEPANLVELGDAAQAAGNSRGAASAFKRAAAKQEQQLETQRENGAGWVLLALCDAKIDRHPAALDALAKAGALRTSDMESQLLEIRTLAVLRKPELALSLAERCLQRGATAFQLRTLPDLDDLRSTPTFRNILASAHA